MPSVNLHQKLLTRSDLGNKPLQLLGVSSKQIHGRIFTVALTQA